MTSADLPSGVTVDGQAPVDCGQQTQPGAIDPTTLSGYIDPDAVGEAVRPYVIYNNHRRAVEHASARVEATNRRLFEVVQIVLAAADRDEPLPAIVDEHYDEVRPAYETAIETLEARLEALESTPTQMFDASVHEFAGAFERAVREAIERNRRLLALSDRLLVRGERLHVDETYLEAEGEALFAEIESIARETEETKRAVDAATTAYLATLNRKLRADRGLFPVWWIPSLRGPLNASPVRRIVHVGTWVVLFTLVGYGLTEGPGWLALATPIAFLVFHNLGTLVLAVASWLAD